MNCYKRGGAGGVDGHARTMPVKEIRHAIRNDGTTLARGSVGHGSFPVSIDGLGPVIAHHADIYAGISTTETLDGLSTSTTAEIKVIRESSNTGDWSEDINIQGIIYCFHEQTLLRIYGLCFSRLDIEKGIVKASHVFLEKVCVARVRGAMVRAVWVEVCCGVEAVVRNSLGQIAWGFEQIPEFGGRARASWKATSHADDGNGLLIYGCHDYCNVDVQYVVLVGLPSSTCVTCT